VGPVTKPEIRLAEPGDADRILALVNSVYRGESGMRGWTSEAHLIGGPRATPRLVSDWIAEPGTAILVSEAAGALDGCVKIESREDGAHIGLLSVSVDAQKRKLGSALLEAAESHAKRATGADTAVLWVLSVRPELISWYERRGYADSGRREPFPYGEDEIGVPFAPGLEFIVMTKAL
jgi:ribosomal protein S18 acetylase RimI-like enzyme